MYVPSNLPVNTLETTDEKIKFRSNDINPSLLPSSHTWTHEPNPRLTKSELYEKIIPYLKSININIPNPNPNTNTNTTNQLDLTLIGNTWSRAARRKLKLQPQTEAHNKGEIPIRITLDVSDGKVEMRWRYGKDSADIESFWNSMLAKTGLITRTGALGRGKRSADMDDNLEGSRKVSRSDIDTPA
jgi:hypothetical protein